MKVGFVGLGKLGLPCALSIENKGHEVVGTDIDPNVAKYVQRRVIPYREGGTPELLQTTNLKVVSLEETIKHSEIVFCPVQTPHLPKYEGITRLPDERVDFDYTALKTAIKQIADETAKQSKDIVLVIISTVLPGTVEREIKPLLNKHIKLSYNPFFIAMGTTRKDFEDPEFVLLGCDDEEATEKIKSLYRTIHNKPIYETSVAHAEAIKVLYNTYISGKIAFANTIGMLSEEIGLDADEIVEGLFLATERLISTKYMRAGMGDGGGCHPRDNIALSWLSRELNLPFDWFENIMLQREIHTEWLADKVEAWIETTKLPVVMCGTAFKRGTNLEIGSPAVLLLNILKERGIEAECFDPHVMPDKPMPDKASIFFIGVNHENFENMRFPKGSVVIDPWGIVEEQDGVQLVRIGRK